MRTFKRTEKKLSSSSSSSSSSWNGSRMESWELKKLLEQPDFVFELELVQEAIEIMGNTRR